jgi:S1-C subfamily serine protease
MRSTPRTSHARAALAMFAGLLALAAPRAEEGMWPPDRLPLAHLRETWGFAPDAAWVSHVMRASVRLAGVCSGSFVSPEGLVMTNQHCVEECLDRLSSPDRDTLRDGFLARTRDEERRCAGVELERLESITDVTERIERAARGREGAARDDARDAEIARVESECTERATGNALCEVVELSPGATQYLYMYRRFDDVRLVFAPEYDIAQFGGDPDNFNFPRFDFDLAFLRAYESGRPARTDDFLRFASQDAKPGELTITSGHPGDTQRRDTGAQLERLRDVDGPWNLARLAEQRGMVTRFAQESAANARMTRVELDDIENSLKSWAGMLLALQDPALLASKRADESALRAFAAARPALKEDLGAWDAIASAEAAWREIAPRYRFTEDAEGTWTRYFDIARFLVRAADERARSESARLREFTGAALAQSREDAMSDAPIHPAFEQLKLAWSLAKMREWLGADDPLVRQVLGRESPEVLAARWVGQTRLADVAVREQLWKGGQAAVAASDDPFIRLARILEPESRALRRRFEAEVDSVEQRESRRIAQVRFARSGADTWPDADFTLRMSFGIVAGWTRAGKPVPASTTVDGLYERATGFDPFRLPPSWLEARRRLDPAQAMNFVTTNDIVGGNSGSPMIDREGRIVGLVFDGNFESLAGAFWWDERSNRTVAMPASLIMQALEKVYRAEALKAEIEGR